MSKGVNTLILMLFFTLACSAQVREESLEFVFGQIKFLEHNKEVPNLRYKDIFLRFERGDVSGKSAPTFCRESSKRSYLKVYDGNSLTFSCVDAVITKLEFEYIGMPNKDLFTVKLKNDNIWRGESQKITLVSKSSSLFKIVKIKVTYKPSSVSVKVSDARYCSLYYGDRAFIIPNGVVARTYKFVGDKLQRSKEYVAGMVLPRGTAVILNAAPNTYNFVVTNKDGVKDEDNVLRGTDHPVKTTSGDIYYAFTDGDQGYGFYWMNPTGAAFKNGAHKAYLPYKNAAGVKGFVGFDTTTSINDEPHFDTTIDESPIYNLSGQRVDKDYKGIVIINGKKYLRK